MSDRIIIDTRSEPQEPKELDADLIIEIDLFDDGYTVRYIDKKSGLKPDYVCVVQGLTRGQMISHHVDALRELKPRTAVVRTGKHSTGHIKDIPLNPGVLKLIIEGKLDAAKLMLRG